MKLQHLLLLAACLLCATRTSLSISCDQPTWQDVLGPNPVASYRGKVVLVALLKGYCGYCALQAQRMEILKAQLAEEGYPDIEMLIVNGGEPLSRNNIDRLINASSIPVLQDTEDHVMYSQIFMGNKDDFVVYDRCGQRSYFIYHPYSDLGRYRYTKLLLRRAHRGRHRCQCSLDQQPEVSMDDVMVGDAPASSRLTTSMAILRNRQGRGGSGGTTCAPGDARCNQLRQQIQGTMPILRRRNAFRNRPGANAAAVEERRRLRRMPFALRLRNLSNRFFGGRSRTLLNRWSQSQMNSLAALAAQNNNNNNRGVLGTV